MIEPEDQVESDPKDKQREYNAGFGLNLDREALTQLKLKYKSKGLYLYECPGCAHLAIVNLPNCHLCGFQNDFQDRSIKNFVMQPLSEACIADLNLLYEAAEKKEPLTRKIQDLSLDLSVISKASEAYMDLGKGQSRCIVQNQDREMDDEDKELLRNLENKHSDPKRNPGMKREEFKMTDQREVPRALQKSKAEASNISHQEYENITRWKCPNCKIVSDFDKQCKCKLSVSDFANNLNDNLLI